MGFLEYNTKFLSDRLNIYESKYASQKETPKEIINEAKIMLKFLCDMKDEGYTATYCYVNDKIDAVDRLKRFIVSCGDKPFEMEKHLFDINFTYATKEQSLHKYLFDLIKNATEQQNSLDKIPKIFYDILDYSFEIFRDADYETEYCFLLRDALLPYLAFEFWDKQNKISTRPLLISRKYLSFFDDGQNENGVSIYGEIQNYMFDGLGFGITNFMDLTSYVKKIIFRKNRFKKLINTLSNELSKITKEKILIIESGYIGTVPLLLSCLDRRVDFRMFTTLPYFYNVYKDKFFTTAFEKMRCFETIICQDGLFQISSVSGSNINVVETDNVPIKNFALAELRTWFDILKNHQIYFI